VTPAESTAAQLAAEQEHADELAALHAFADITHDARRQYAFQQSLRQVWRDNRNDERDRLGDADEGAVLRVARQTAGQLFGGAS
jgi:hypothetical protein